MSKHIFLHFTEVAMVSDCCASLYLEDGQLFTWGQNTNGQLGLGKGESSKLFPQPLKSLAGIPLAKITAGGDHSFALSLSGAVFGWGKNKAGQLGLNDKQGMYNWSTEAKGRRRMRYYYS